MKKQKNSLPSKIAAYPAIAASLIAAAGSANAQIVYTNITDYTGTNDQDAYALDLNNDGTTDYTIKRADIPVSSYYSSSSGTAKTVQVMRNSSNEMARKGIGSYSTSAAAIPMKKLIDTGLTWVNTNNSGTGFMAVNFNNANYGPWVNQKDKYLALKLIKNSMTYYGWARLDVGKNSDVFTIKDYAYESTPNTGILAGNQGIVGIEVSGLQGVSIFAADKKITVNLSEADGEARISVRNVLGQELNNLVTRERGTEISMEGANTGVYFVTITRGTISGTAKIYIQ